MQRLGGVALPLLFMACTPALTTLAQGDGGTVRLSPDQDVNRIIESATAGTRFVLADGVYRGFAVVPKDGQQFVAEGEAAILDGSVQLDDWRQEDGYWVHDLPPARSSQGDATGDALSLQIEDLFVDEALLTPVRSLDEVGEGTWHRAGDRAHVSFDPSGRHVELGLLPHAFYGPAADVLIEGLTVRQYAPGAQFGAIEGNAGRAWQLVDVTTEWNHGRGISMSPEGVVRGGRFVDNGQLGIGGPGQDMLIEGAEIARNNYADYNRLWEAGGLKITDSERVTLRNNHVHHNFGTGVWFDWDVRGLVIEDNLVELNQTMGVQIEASRDNVVRNNVVARNDTSGYDEAWWGAEILIQNSAGTLVQDNTVVVEHNTGIMLIQQDRGAGDFGEHLAQGNVVTGNTIILLSPDLTSGLWADFKPEAASGNRFEGNRYIVPEAAADQPLWQVPGGDLAWSELASIGWETAGEIQVVADPEAFEPDYESWRRP